MNKRGAVSFAILGFHQILSLGAIFAFYKLERMLLNVWGKANVLNWQPIYAVLIVTPPIMLLFLWREYRRFRQSIVAICMVFFLVVLVILVGVFSHHFGLL